MDAWQAAQNWLLFGAVAGGLAYYYYPRGKTIQPVKEVQKEIKKIARKGIQEKARAPSSVVGDAPREQTVDKVSLQNGKKKRKTVVQPAAEISEAPAVDNENDMDMSTRQFAANMQKAREGIRVQSKSHNETRLRTVKPKSDPSNTPVLTSGSLQVNADDDWASADSSTLKAGGVDDMLEPVASGPSALRITASEKPKKEKVDKQPRKDVTETKKQRQNRQKIEDARLAREAADREHKARGELQRRTAREARGEPAKNGISIAAAPVTNPWAEQNAARDAHLPVTDNHGHNVQLFDTLDTESTSSSNQGNSTAATSVVADTTPSRFADDDDFNKAIQESGLESGWNEVKSSKKQKGKPSQPEPNGTTTPLANPSANGKAVNSIGRQPGNSRPVGFQALSDEGEQNETGDLNDPTSWTA